VWWWWVPCSGCSRIASGGSVSIRADRHLIRPDGTTGRIALATSPLAVVPLETAPLETAPLETRKLHQVLGGVPGTAQRIGEPAHRLRPRAEVLGELIFPSGSEHVPSTHRKTGRLLDQLN
jgi:hypothetical protein